MKTSTMILSAVAVSTAVALTACQSNEVSGPRGDVPPPMLQPVASLETQETAPEVNTPALTPNSPVSAIPEAPVPAVPAFEMKPEPATFYVVKKGDNPWTIANMYGVSVNEFIAENNLTQKSVLRVNQQVKIPAGGAYLPPEKRKKYKVQTPKKTITSKRTHKVSGKAESTATETKVSATAAAGEYKVQSGDYPEKIAKKHGISVSEFMAANPGLNPKKMSVNQIVKVPGKTTSAEATATTTTSEPVTHDVTPVGNTGSEIIVGPTPANTTDIAAASTQTLQAEEGETLRSIAQDFSFDVLTLKSLNPSLSEDVPLKKGTVVTIPKAL